MNRATVIYILMIVAGVGGLWLILRLGSGLAAPSDLSGVWGVGGEDPTLPAVLGDTLYVEQSGRYARFNFERGLTVDLRLVSETRPNADTGEGLELRFEGPPWSLAARGSSAAGPLIFRLEGPEPHTFTVTRVRPNTDDADGSGVGGAEAAAAEEHAALPDPAPTADAGADAP